MASTDLSLHAYGRCARLVTGIKRQLRAGNRFNADNLPAGAVAICYPALIN